MVLNSFNEGGVTYYQLYIACPVDYSGCRSSIVRSFCMHGDYNCYGDIYVGDNAFFKCKKCGQSVHVSNCRYSCPVHSNTPDELVFFDGADARSVSVTMSVAGQMVEMADMLWLRRFLGNCSKGKGE